MASVTLPQLKELDASPANSIDILSLKKLEAQLVAHYGETNVHSMYLAPEEPAYFGAEFEIDGDGNQRREEIYIRFSRWGRLCALVCEETTPKEERKRLETWIADINGLIVSEDLLNTAYDGSQSILGFATWWDRYFDFSY